MRTNLKVIWATSNLLLTLFFGVLHQGGVVPSLFYLHDQISVMGPLQGAHIIYWKTYMPPRHLLAIHEQGNSSHCVSVFAWKVF